jgi:aminopeptidase N
MFNRGMQTRLADAPLWLNEGMANWFETPDLTKKIGWQRPGMVNGLRLNQLRKYLANRPENSLQTLVSSDNRFEGDGALEAYAESWALVHFLMKRRKKEFRAYLKAIANKRPGFPVSEETRLKEFLEHFKDLKKLDKAFQARLPRASARRGKEKRERSALEAGVSQRHQSHRKPGWKYRIEPTRWNC